VRRLPASTLLPSSRALRAGCGGCPRRSSPTSSSRPAPAARVVPAIEVRVVPLSRAPPPPTTATPTTATPTTASPTTASPLTHAYDREPDDREPLPDQLGTPRDPPTATPLVVERQPSEPHGALDHAWSPAATRSRSRRAPATENRFWTMASDNRARTPQKPVHDRGVDHFHALPAEQNGKSDPRRRPVIHPTTGGRQPRRAVPMSVAQPLRRAPVGVVSRSGNLPSWSMATPALGGRARHVDGLRATIDAFLSSPERGDGREHFGVRPGRLRTALRGTTAAVDRPSRALFASALVETARGAPGARPMTPNACRQSLPTGWCRGSAVFFCAPPAVDATGRSFPGSCSYVARPALLCTTLLVHPEENGGDEVRTTARSASCRTATARIWRSASAMTAGRWRPIARPKHHHPAGRARPTATAKTSGRGAEGQKKPSSRPNDLTRVRLLCAVSEPGTTNDSLLDPR